MYVCVPLDVWCPQRSEEGIRSPETGVTKYWKLLYGFWEMNPGPLQEQVLLTSSKRVIKQYAIIHEEPHILWGYFVFVFCLFISF